MVYFLFGSAPRSRNEINAHMGFVRKKRKKIRGMREKERKEKKLQSTGSAAKIEKDV